MSQEARTSKSVEDLEVFKRAYALSLEVHKGSLGFAKIEQYGGLADQLRRSSKSVCALLMEGAGRQRSSDVEFRRYVVMAMSSADEARLWCLYARDLGYIDDVQWKAWHESYREVARMCQGLIARLTSSGH